MVGSADAWARLIAGLGEPDAREHAGEARVGATLALLDARDGDCEIVYTKRRDDLRTHPGQIAFPGGRLDPGETVPEAALREAAEEIGLQPASATVLGALPAFYVPPSRYWLQTVVGRWDRPHALTPADDEVAAIVRVRVSALSDPARWRAVWLPVSGWTWAWQLEGDYLLWGATAVVTAQLLDLLTPGWSAGTSPSALPAERRAEPWRDRGRWRARGLSLPGARVLPAGEAPPPWADPPTPERLDAVGAACARAARGLEADRVMVLVGGGGNGLAGIAAAAHAARDGRQVTVVADRPVEQLAPAARDRLTGLTVLELPTDLPRADLCIDALVGGGLRGTTLEGGARRLLLALRRTDAPVLALDLPSGMDARRGIVGECVPARLCLALGGPRPGTLQAGVEPFVGDLYAVGDDGSLVRTARHSESARSEEPASGNA